MTLEQLDAVTMDAADGIPAGTVFAVDVETRTIRGRAVPYGVVGVKNGKRFMFSQGSIRPREGMTVKLWGLHDKAQAVGVNTEWTDTPEGLDVAFRVARGADGDRALGLADEGVWDGLSIGPSEGALYRLVDDVYHAVDIPIHEISLTPAPVFGGARVRSVSFDQTREGNTRMTTTTTEPATVVETHEPVTFDMSTLAEPLGAAIAEAFSHLNPNPQGREVVDPTASFEVNEPSPYRFDGLPAEHSFSLDLRASMGGDGEARQRLAEFVEELESFAVTVADASALNPTKNRPDLYVPNLTFNRPLWDLVTTGVITDITAFTIPKFSSASGLVGAHSAGVEPTPGAFAATVQTVTPTAVSGKIEILREVWDQGGSPQADGIIWGEMLQGWYEALESRIATALAAVATAELNLASAVDSALVNAITDYFAGLNFVRGGNRFTAFAADGSLFPKLVSAADSTGRKLLPVLGPTNAQGQVSGAFDRVQLGNTSIVAAWALGTGNAAKSYNFVPSSVWAWASTPKRFDFEYQVKSVDLAIWGYGAAAVTRDSDVKPIDYTVADA